MARIPFRLPDIGEGIAEAEIVAWHVQLGDHVEEDQPFADLMTDKATVEMSAPVSGRVVELAGAVGDLIAIGSTLAVFETEAGAESAAPVAPPATEPAAVPVAPAPPESPITPAPAAPPAAERPAPAPVAAPSDEAAPASARVLASPAVRARAKALGVDLAGVRPAQGDRVRHADLDAYLRYASPAPAGAAAPRAPRADAEEEADSDAVEEIKITGLRRRIAERMAETKRRIPHFAYVEETDVTALEALRQAMNAERGERPKLTLLPFLVRALCLAAAEHPVVNARYDDEAGLVQRFRAVHLGIATQTEAGLSVPVVRDAQARSVWDLAAEIARLADATRRGKASREELSGSTLTLTSLGALGGIASTPVLNRPEVAIVGVNRMVDRPVVVQGRIEVRTMMNLSSSFDHRIVDGMDAARFIQAVKRRIEVPALLFAE
ncbi:dihydrolipoamide acetyltransferase family protein [Sphingomonas morindae]|uniref:Dihydrolipoamide acetyltransferase component of pyruvate dehydrogenase complex n=1 Tax=Sphingomonas morindae TaxID=1541170 RepID=A0ABY4X680_9SPHN|nr:dihydrolipoamide acetyltransferase family protein [Sphingomonas morindae]USI72412.1 2-oxo acid dehydrogenase subunit E2 [Sphingomonas morindae]